ncbi:MAG TPA: PA14 domain-containing protein, partial [Abditibacteriaceae bacterium]
MTQNSTSQDSSPETQASNKKRQPLWVRATVGSIIAHTVFLTAMYFMSEPPKPPGEALLIVDLQQEKPKQKAVPTPKPTAEPTAVPTPEPTAEPTPIPTAEPTPIPTVEPTPIPTVEKPKPVPTKKAEAVKPQPTAIPTPEANEGKKPKAVATPKPIKATPVRPEKTPQRLAGLRPQPKQGDGAPKSTSKPRSDELAGADADAPSSSARRNNTNRRREVDDLFNKPETGGQNDKAETPLPQGLQTGRRDANRNDLAPGKLDSNLRGIGRPGGGSSGNFSPNPDKGSRNGVNSELAGSDGGGGANLPRRIARRGGGGGDDARFPILDRDSKTAVAIAVPGFSPGLGGGQGGGRGGGAGNNSGAGIGTRLAGADRGALNTRKGSGVGGGNGPGVGGPRGSGNGGEIAGGGGGSGGGFGRGQGSGYGDGKGGYGGGNGRRKGSIAGDPFGDPNGSRGGNGTGGGTGGGPGGPGKGPLLAMRGGDGPGDGQGNGAGRGPGGRGAGGGTGPGRGAGGFGKGPGSGKGNGSGDGGKPGIGGGNGGGGRGGDGPAGNGPGGNGDGEAGNGSGGKGRPYRVRPGAQREIEGENSIGRGIWAPGFQIEFFQDESDHPDMPDATFNPGHPIDWKPFTKLIAKDTAPILNFNWGTKPPAKGMRHTFWSMRAVGRIFVPKDDTYEFYFDALDDAGRLYLDGKKIIDIWWVQKSTPASKGYFLKKGPHDLMIEYVQGPATEASIKL